MPWSFPLQTTGATRVTLGGKEEPGRAQSSAQREKGSKVFLLSPGTTFPSADPPRSPSLSRESYPLTFSTPCPFSFSSLLLDPFFPQLQVCKARKEWVVQCCPPSQALFRVATTISLPQKGTWMYCLHDLCIFSPET